MKISNRFTDNWINGALVFNCYAWSIAALIILIFGKGKDRWPISYKWYFIPSIIIADVILITLFVYVVNTIFDNYENKK
jgi:hypothetical protein